MVTKLLQVTSILYNTHLSLCMYNLWYTNLMSVHVRLKATHYATFPKEKQFKPHNISLRL